MMVLGLQPTNIFEIGDNTAFFIIVKGVDIHLIGDLFFYRFIFNKVTISVYKRL